MCGSLFIKTIHSSRCTAVIKGSFSSSTPCISHFWMIFSAFLAVLLFLKISIRNFRQLLLFPASMPDYFIVYEQGPQVKLMVFVSLLLWSLLLLHLVPSHFEDQDREFSIYYIVWPWKCLILSSLLSQNDLHLAIITAPHCNCCQNRGKVECLPIMISSAFCLWGNSPNTFWINALGLSFLNSLFIL